MSKKMLLLLCVVGCGRAAVPGPEAPEEVPAPPQGSNTPPVGTNPPPAKNEIAIDEQRELESFLGPAGPGGAVYSGTASARDNLGTLGAWYRDGVIDASPVLAGLEKREAGQLPQGCTSGHVLTLVSTSQSRHVTVSQCAPGSNATTWLSLVNALNTSGGVSATCSGCAPALAALPDSLRLGPASATGRFGGGQTLTVSLDATLTRKPVVTFAELLELAQASPRRREQAKAFKPSGDGWVLERTLERRTSAAIPAGGTHAFTSCELVTAYRAQWWVADPVSRWEVRDVTAGATQMCCRERVGEGCAPDTIVCFHPPAGS